MALLERAKEEQKAGRFEVCNECVLCLLLFPELVVALLKLIDMRKK